MVHVISHQGSTMRRSVALAILLGISSAAGLAEPPGTSSPTLGGSPARNPVNLVDRGIPAKFDPEKDCLWKADLGSVAYGGPVVAGGKVFVGTNNDRPRNLRDTRIVDGEQEPIDKGVLMCFDEKTGR